MIDYDKVSIIVPVYNVKKYLKKCLNSLLNQSYPNYEIVLVDDGSSDGSSLICDEYGNNRGENWRGKHSPDIKVLHKKNAGVSEARNSGLDLSTGDWIIFVDGDDWIPKDAVSFLVNTAKTAKAEYVVGAFKYIMPGRDFRDQMADLEFSPVSTGAANNIDAIQFFSSLKYYSYNCKKIFKTEIIKKNKIRFRTDMKVSEDTAFILQYLMHCERIRSVNQVVYYYNNLRNNGSGSKYYPNRSIWADYCLNLYDQAIFRFINSDKEKERLLSNYTALRIFRDVRAHIIGCNNDEDRSRKCSETFSLLSKYIKEPALDTEREESKLYFALSHAIRDEKLNSFCNEYADKISSLRTSYINVFARKIIGNVKLIRYYGK